MGIGGGDGGGYILVANIKSYSYLCNHERPPQKKEKRASELIRLDMKEKETVRAREEER